MPPFGEIVKADDLTIAGAAAMREVARRRRVKYSAPATLDERREPAAQLHR